MLINEYQEIVINSATYPIKYSILYPAFKLAMEVSKIEEKINKTLISKVLSDELPEEDKTEIAKNLGEMLLYIAILARDINYTLNDIATMNIVNLKPIKEINNNL